MTEKSPEELYNERQARVLAAAKCQQPDRIPVFGPFQKYPYQFGGITFKQAMNDYPLARAACHKFLDYFQPDVDFGPIFAYPAKAMETIGFRPSSGRVTGWPTTYVPVHRQRVHDRDEYDEFVYDPSGFMFGKWAPRQFTRCCFAQLPVATFHVDGMDEHRGIAGPGAGDFQPADEVCRDRWWGHQVQYWGELKEKGYPLPSPPGTGRHSTSSATRCAAPATSWPTCDAAPANCTMRWKSRRRYSSSTSAAGAAVHLDLGPQVDPRVHVGRPVEEFTGPISARA